MRARSFSFAACLSVLALTPVVAGCGGGSGSKSKGGASGFAAQADAVCSQESAAEVAATRTPALNTRAATQQVDALVAARESALRKLRALSPPADKAAYRAFLAQWAAIEPVWRRSVAQIAKGAGAYDANGAAAPALERAQTAAAKAKLTTCAGRLPSSDVAAITSLIRAGQLHPTASICTKSTSKRFLSVTGGLKPCLQSTKTHSAQVQITNLRGTPALATARVARAGGNQPPAKLVFWFVKQSGHWQLDDAY